MNKSVLYDNILQNHCFIAGPCVLESYDIAMQCAQALCDATYGTAIVPVFKASFDKANRTSVHGYRGVGIDEGIRIFERIKQEFSLPITTDIHELGQAARLSSVVDILQIPALLCRQTSLLLDAVQTGNIVNIKKGQFLSPQEVVPLYEKATSTGNNKILITERGTVFGYNTLVVDFRCFAIMQKHAIPIIYDVTHSVQMPGAQGSSSGGKREFAPLLMRSAVAAGVQGIFAECHPSPEKALCDGPNSIPLTWLKPFVRDMQYLWDSHFATAIIQSE